jgi:hypothetical protein
MPTEISSALRNASNRRVAAIRKEDPLELEVFLKEWRLRLIRKGKVWKGPLAVAELRRKKVFEFLLCERKGKYDWRAEDLLSRILCELKAYREESNGRLAKEYFDDADEFFNGLIRKIQKEESKSNIRELKSLLEGLRKKVERTRKATHWLKERKRNWHYGVWQRSWRKVPRKNLVSRKIELDTRLQVELGKMFGDYLGPEGVSLETIARLILLAYWVGGLATMNGKKNQAICTNRVLKVRNIRDNLRFARLHKAVSFRGNRT